MLTATMEQTAPSPESLREAERAWRATASFISSQVLSGFFVVIPLTISFLGGGANSAEIIGFPRSSQTV